MCGSEFGPYLSLSIIVLHYSMSVSHHQCLCLFSPSYFYFSVYICISVSLLTSNCLLQSPSFRSLCLLPSFFSFSLSHAILLVSKNHSYVQILIQSLVSNLSLLSSHGFRFISSFKFHLLTLLSLSPSSLITDYILVIVYLCPYFRTITFTRPLISPWWYLNGFIFTQLLLCPHSCGNILPLFTSVWLNFLSVEEIAEFYQNVLAFSHT